ncbi:MAG: hypothetical protein AAFV88_22835 [Planctomycetota bacterium]
MKLHTVPSLPTRAGLQSSATLVFGTVARAKALAAPMARRVSACMVNQQKENTP